MKITICCYNIHSGKNIFYWPTLKKMIRFFQKNPMDILVLQEVQNNSKNGWQYHNIKESLGLEGDYGANLSIYDGHYGNATFSRFPVIHSENQLLPSAKEQRGALCTTLSIHGHPVQIVNTHLGLSQKERTNQTNRLQQLISNDIPTILAGDFNSSTSYTFPSLLDLAKKAGKEGQPTIFPLNKRIDYIFTSPSFELIDYEVLKLEYSDHYPIQASVCLL